MMSVFDMPAKAAWGRAILAALVGLTMALCLGLAAPTSIDLDMGAHDAAIVEGVHQSERMYTRQARWTNGLAHIEWPGQFGVRPVAVEIELAPFFGRGGDQVEITVNGRTRRHRLLDDWHTARVPVSGVADVLVVEIRSEVHHAATDPRPLGVRLDRVTILNGPRTAWLHQRSWAPLAILTALGALAWIAGAWLGDERHDGWGRAYGVAWVGSLWLLLHALRAWLLSPGAVLILAGAAVLALALMMTLRRRGACSRRAALAVAIACAAAWLANAVVTSWYFVDVLRLDAWESVHLVEESMAGALRWPELWGLHNEHRPLTGRLVALACAHLAHWNHWWEFASLQVVAALQIIVIAAYVAARHVYWRAEASTLIASAAMICATSHWENWLRGFSVHILFGALGPSVALLVLCQRRPGWVSLAFAAAAAIVGQLSFGTGLLVWPLGALVIVLRRHASSRPHLAVWLAAAVVAVALYLPGLHVHPDATAQSHSIGSLAGWGRIAAGMLVTLAMPLHYAPGVFESGSAVQQMSVMALAASGVVACAWLLMWRWRQDDAGEQAWLFPGVLALFGLSSCALMAAGRVSSGLLAMTASRYLIFAACFWIGLLLLAGLHAGTARPWSRLAANVLAVAVVVTALLGSASAMPYMQGEWDRVRPARLQLIRGAVSEAAGVLYPDPLKLAHMRDVLQQHRLSVFRPGAR